jgi:hypothetical protein
MSWFSDLFKKKEEPVPQQLEEFPEAKGARELWWSKLQEWGKQPGYGAISPEWDEIWNLAKNKLTQYYWGGTMDTGLAGKVKASAARRNVSQSPALENMLTAMGMQEAQDVSGLASTEAINKARFGETGRLNWLQSLMGITGQKPSYYTPASTSDYSGGNFLMDILGGGMDIFQQYQQQEYLTKQQTQQQDWLTNLFNQYSGGTGGTSLQSNYGAAKNDYSDLASTFPNLFKTY